MKPLKTITINGEAYVPTAATGIGEPTSETVGVVGHLYMDTDTGDLYKCTAVTDGVYTWKLVINLSGYYTKEEIEALSSLLADNIMGQVKSDYYSAVQIDNMVGDISTVLDSIIALQNDLMGLIYFTIKGVKYTAVDGMTWEDWCDSEYNTCSAYVSKVINTPYVYIPNDIYNVDPHISQQYYYTEIQAGAAYSIVNTGS